MEAMEKVNWPAPNHTASAGAAVQCLIPSLIPELQYQHTFPDPFQHHLFITLVQTGYDKPINQKPFTGSQNAPKPFPPLPDSMSAGWRKPTPPAWGMPELLWSCVPPFLRTLQDSPATSQSDWSSSSWALNFTPLFCLTALAFHFIHLYFTLRYLHQPRKPTQTWPNKAHPFLLDLKVH
jgi:hypothetical protein